METMVSCSGSAADEKVLIGAILPPLTMRPLTASPGSIRTLARFDLRSNAADNFVASIALQPMKRF